VLNVGGWAWWIRSLLGVSRLRSPLWQRLSLIATPPLCLAALLVLLLTAAAPAVRASPFYIIWYEMLGGVWLCGSLHSFDYLGISPRGDAVERANRAAHRVAVCATVAVTLCFAGANIGDGPGPEAVIPCAVLSTASLFGAWALVGRLAPAWIDAVTIDRDVRAGNRLGALLIVLGLVFGYAVTGDWHSMEETLRDFAIRAWPGALLAVVAARWLSPRGAAQ